MSCVVCHKIYSANDDNDFDEKPHLCTTCGLSFTFKIQLKRHVTLHADGAPYTCKYCVKESEKKGQNYNLRLGTGNNCICEVCHESFPNKRSLLRHSIQHTYESEEGFEENIKITLKKRVFPHISKHISKKASETQPIKLSLKRHWSYTKSKSKTLVCDACNKCFAYQACLDKHIKTGKCSSVLKLSPKHFGEDSTQENKNPSVSSKNKENKKVKENSDDGDLKKHACSICGKTFARKSSLEGHEISHVLNKETSEDERYFSDIEKSCDDLPRPKKSRLSHFKFQRSYTCDKCNFVCFSNQTLNKHMANHHKNYDALTDKVQNEESTNSLSEGKSPSCKLEEFEKEIGDNSYTCEKCRKKFKNKNKLVEHNCENAKKDKTKIKDSKKKFSCEICEENFISKRDLKHHLFSHVEGNADESLDKKDTWMKHSTKKSKDFSCDICGRRFAGEICLKKHQIRHTEDVNKTEAGTHSRGRKAKPVKELICEYCNEEFTGKRSAYIKHIHAHTPEVCGICDERFIDRQSLRNHCKIHVGTEEGRMFMQCSQKALDAKNAPFPEPKVEYIYLVVR